jgi:arginase
MGPDAIRVAGLHRKLKQLGYQVRDKGNVCPSMREYGRDGASNYLAEIVALNEQVMKYVTEAFDEGATPLVLGGDHSLAIGSTAASAARYGNLGVVWIDTHADMNNPQSSVTKNIHGMPLSTLLHDGYQELIGLVQNKLDPKKIVLIGLRDLDKTERILLAKSGVNYFTMRDVDEIGIQGVLEILTTKIFKEVAHLHVSFDLDVMDPIYAPGVSTPINGGLNTREAHLLLEMLHETKKN